MNTPKFRKIFLTAIIGIILYTLFLGVDSFISVRFPSSFRPTELYANHLRDDLRLVYTKAIAEAKESVVLVIYALSDNQVIQALRKKAEEGIDVLVVCDANASRNAIARLGNHVRTSKIQPHGLMHMKMLVIDKTNTWIGSANMTTESLRLHGNLVFGFYSPSLAKVVIDKATNMDHKIKRQYFSFSNDQDLELWFLPDNEDAVERLLQLIQSAKKTLQVAMFTWTRTDLAQAVIDAQKRGVKVEVVIDKNAGFGSSKQIAELFKKSNVPLFFSQGSALLHYKLMVVDEDTVVNGSANWTRAAFTQNDDCFCVLKNLNSSQKKMMQGLWDVIVGDALRIEASIDEHLDLRLGYNRGFK